MDKGLIIATVALLAFASVPIGLKSSGYTGTLNDATICNDKSKWMLSKTKLLYLEDFIALDAEARVQEIAEENDKTVVILDATIFYPQGGGQPYDKGAMESGVGKFIVEETRFADGIVKHIGHFEKGGFSVGEQVKLSVDPERRLLHSRLHSAGHVVDMAVAALGLPWIPGKGFHFPQGPYVEYAGSLDGLDKDRIKGDLEELCKKFISENLETRIVFPTPDEMKKIMARNPAAIIPGDKPGRVVMFGSLAELTTGSGQAFGVPCGGTHVQVLGEIGAITIRKIKAEGLNIRVGYGVVQ